MKRPNQLLSKIIKNILHVAHCYHKLSWSSPLIFLLKNQAVPHLHWPNNQKVAETQLKAIPQTRATRWRRGDRAVKNREMAIWLIILICSPSSKSWIENLQINRYLTNRKTMRALRSGSLKHKIKTSISHRHPKMIFQHLKFKLERMDIYNSGPFDNRFNRAVTMT